MQSLIFQEKLLNSLEANKDLIAIEENGQLISYAELLETANKITSFILEQGLKKETFIGISVDSKFQLISSIIGVTNARCVFVPIDSSLPEYRLQQMFQDMNMEYVITSNQEHYIEVIAELTSYKIEDILTKEQISQPVVFPEYHEDDSLYVYFTSGTTGKPKGIIGKNSSLLQFLEWEIKKFNFGETTRFSQLISPYFDAFLRDVFAPLLSGGIVCVPPLEEDFFSSEKMINWIDQNRVNVIHCVPSMFRIINKNDLTSENFTKLTHILLSGEKIIPSELVNWYAIFDSRIQLVNLYGTTETTMVRVCYEITKADAEKSKIPIGSPIDATELLIANADFKPCSPLITGDLYIVSKYTTKGYLNNQDLTREKFIKLYENTPDEVIAFKTGDKARKLANGQVELLGREDRQVKIRGLRIELDEIEQVLLKSSLVKNAIVVSDIDLSSKHHSITPFVIKEDVSMDSVFFENSIKNHLKDYLPEYMIPSIIVEVKEYPLLSNGKIDVRKLLDSARLKPTVLPSSKIETELWEIWKEIFGERVVSTKEDFQSIGGDSLSLLALVTKIYKHFNVRFSLSQIFSHSSIQKQAEFIAKAKAL